MGDTACDILIAGGGLLLAVFPVVWLVQWLRGDKRKGKSIYIKED